MNISVALPKKVESSEELSKVFPNWNYKEFEAKVGIKQRHLVEEGETALDLAFEASSKCLEAYNKADIDMVILCTQSPDYKLPTSACILHERLGLEKSCGAFDYNLGCSGFVYGLSIVKGFLKANVASNVLLVMSETYSKSIHPEDRSNRSIFGDGAAAMVLSVEDVDNIGNFELFTDGSGYDKLIIKNGGARHLYDKDAKKLEYGTENIYDDNHIYMNGPDIFKFTIDRVPKLVETTLEKNAIAKEDVDYYIFHQANAFILNFLCRKIKLPKDRFCIDIANTGNTVSATIPIALKNEIDRGDVKEGDKVMLVGFGVGLSMGATIVEL